MFTEQMYFCDCVSAKLYPAHCESGALHSARVPTFRVKQNVRKSYLLCHISVALYSALRYFIGEFENIFSGVVVGYNKLDLTLALNLKSTILNLNILSPLKIYREKNLSKQN